MSKPRGNIKYPVVDGNKQCSKCKEWAPVAEFLRKGDSIRNTCRACYTAYHRAVYHKRKVDLNIPSIPDHDYSLVGKRFGKLEVMSFSHKKKGGLHYFNCRCDCGTEKVILRGSLVRGMSESCGCSPAGRKPPKCGTPLNKVINSYRRSATNRDLAFYISVPRFIEITSSNCYYCGSPPSKTITDWRGDITYTYNGIDRVNNLLGYVEGNVVACCTTCNYAKRTQPITEFIEWVRRVYLNLVEKGEI